MKILSMIRKDLKMVLSDKKALAIILVMPIILMVILSFALKGIFVNDELQIGQIKIAVVKEYDVEEDNKSFQDALSSGFITQNSDAGAIGELTNASNDTALASDNTDPEKIFFDEFLESEKVSDIIAYQIETETKARELLKSGEVSAIVLLPQRYIYNVKVNMLTPFRNEIEIKVFTNPDSSLNGQVVTSIMQAYSDAISSIMIGKNVLIESALSNDLGSDDLKSMDTVVNGMRDALGAIKTDVNSVTLEGKKPISSAEYYAAAMLAMFILFAAGHGGRLLLEEKENTTYQRMMVAGTSKFGILTGKFLTVFFIALLQIIVMMTFSHFALSVAWGDFLSIVLIGIAAAFAVAGVGVTVAAAAYRAGNYKMASVFESIIIQMMALFGGSYVPIDVLPEIFQKLSYLSLSGIALKAYQKTMMGYGLEAVQGYIVILTGIGAVFAVISVLILKGKEGNGHVERYKAKTIKA